MSMAPEQTRDKRIILIHTQGPTPGLWVIAGTKHALVGDTYAGAMPPMLGPVPLAGRAGFFGLLAEKPRYIVYREIMVPEGAEVPATQEG